MAKRQEPIRVESYVTVDGREVNTEDLTTEQRRALARWITETMVEAAYPGQIKVTWSA